MDELPIAQNGQFVNPTQSPYLEGATATLECNPGYGTKAAVESTVIKDNNGQLKWDVPSADCVPVLNDLPADPQGQFVSADGQGPYFEGSKATLECNPGYGTRNPVESTVIDDNGQLMWEPPSATCVQVLTELPTSYQGEFISTEHGPYMEGDKATLKCVEGYETKIPFESTLTLDQGQLKWVPPSGRCDPMTLSDLPLATDGQFNGNHNGPYRLRDEATLECYQGFGTKKSVKSTLMWYQGQLQWEPPSATCLPATEDLPQATHGWFSSTHAHSPYTEGDTVELLCEPGYATKESIESTLKLDPQNQLIWDPPSATCELAVDDLPLVRNGQYISNKRDSFVEGDVVQLKCNAGYKSNDPPESMLVMRNGVLDWDPSSATCLPVSCKDPPPLKHGMLIGQDFTFDNTIEYKCDDGYRYNHKDYSFDCNAAGQWEPIIPANLSCDPIECPELQEPENGTVDFADHRFFRSTATFACNQGYEMTSGQAERQCQADGKWSGVDVVCEAMQAQQPAASQGQPGGGPQGQPQGGQPGGQAKPGVPKTKPAVPKASFSYFWIILVVLILVLFSVVFAFYRYR